MTNYDDVQILKLAPIMYAVENRNIEFIKFLLEIPGFDVNISTKRYVYPTHNSNIYRNDGMLYFELPLHKAIDLGYEEIVELLLSNKDIEVNERSLYDLNGKYLEETLLYKAIKSKNIKIFKNLLSNQNIDVNLKSINKENGKEYNETPLYFAIRTNNIEIAKILINHPWININKRSSFSNELSEIKEITKETALNLAVRLKNIELIKILLNHSQIDVNKKVINERNKINKSIYRNYDKPKITKNTTLNIAIFNKDINIISLLLSAKNININSKGKQFVESFKYEWNPLTISIFQNTSEITDILLSTENINVNTEITIFDGLYIIKKSPLLMAIESQNEKLFQSLLSFSNINVNYIYQSSTEIESEVDKVPTLHFALEKGNYQMIKSLITFPTIDINLKSIHINSSSEIIQIDENSILISAAKYGDASVFQLLLSNDKIDIDLWPYLRKINQDNYFIELKEIIKITIAEKKHEILKLLFQYEYDHNYKMSFFEKLIDLTDDEQIKEIINDFLRKTKDKQ